MFYEVEVYSSQDIGSTKKLINPKIHDRSGSIRAGIQTKRFATVFFVLNAQVLQLY